MLNNESHLIFVIIHLTLLYQKHTA